MAEAAKNTLEIAALRFTRDWTNPSDFPTYEPNETQVRADQQYLFNEIRDFLNATLIPAIQEAYEAEGNVTKGVNRVYVSASGHLMVEFANGNVTDLGLYAGGASVAYVTALTVDENGHLIVTMSDESTKDLGKLGGEDVIINETVITNNLYAENGDIANLTVDRLSTSRRIVRYLAGDTSDDNFIRAEDQYLQLVTGTTDGSTVQHTDRYGRPLYWEKDISGASINDLGYPEVDGKQVVVTTDVTAWPVTVYAYTEYVKMQLSFENIPGDGTENYIPSLILGAGDTSDTDRGYIYKLVGSMRIDYLKSDGTIVSIKLSDSGVEVSGAGDSPGLRNIITVKASEFSTSNTYGNVGDIVAVVED